MAHMNDPLPGAGVSFWTMVAAAVVEWLGATHKQERLVALLIYFLGMNVLAGFAHEFRATPGYSSTRRQRARNHAKS